MPDPINEFAKVAYNISKAATYVKEKGQEWGRAVSKNFLKEEGTEEKIKTAEKRLSTELKEPEKLEEPFISANEISEDNLPQQKEAEKTKNVASEFFKNLIERFKASYRTIEQRETIKRDLKESIGTGKSVDELTKEQAATLKVFIATASKSELESLIKQLSFYKAKEGIDSPLARTIFRDIMGFHKDTMTLKLMSNGNIAGTIVENYRTLFAEGHHDEVLELLNSKHSSTNEVILASLLNAPEAIEMSEFEKFPVSKFINDTLMSICLGGETPITKYQKLLMNVPPDHFQTMLKKLWESNPQVALNTIFALQKLDNKELSSICSKFLNNITGSPEQIDVLCKLIYEIHNPALAAQIIEAIPDTVVSGKVIDRLVKEEPTDEKFLVDIANLFITKEIQAADKPPESFDQSIGFKYVMAVQKELVKKNIENLPSLAASAIFLDTYKSVDKDTNEARIINQPGFKENLYQLFSFIQESIQERKSPELRRMYGHLQTEVDKEFPKNGQTAVLNLYMQNINQLLLNPDTQHLGNQAVNLVEFAKVFKKFIFQQEFSDKGADSYLSFTNPILREKLSQDLPRIFTTYLLPEGGQNG